MNSCSYQDTDVIVCRYDRSGMSNRQYGRLMTERAAVKEKIIPARILQDYSLMTYNAQFSNEFVDIALKISSISGGISKVMTAFCKIVYNVYCKLRNIKQ